MIEVKDVRNFHETLSRLGLNASGHSEQQAE